MFWLLLLAVGAVGFFALGWPAETLAADPSKRGGLGWGALTFGAPAAAWFIAGLVAQSRDPSSEVAFGLVFVLGTLSSCTAIVLGTLTARAARRRRQLKGQS